MGNFNAFKGHLRTVGIIQTKRRFSWLPDAKISERRGLLLTVFPHFTLRPKHHFVEHHPQLMRINGPLRDMWTVCFEGKNKFFKQVIHNTKNFKNVPQTPAVRHQSMMAHHVLSSSFFKPSIRMDKMTLSSVSSLPENIQNLLNQRFASQNTVLVASPVSADGIRYSPGVIVSAGACSCLPEFRQIHSILVINSDVLFLCKHVTSWYDEHLRSNELCSRVSSVSVNMLSDLNDAFPLAAYRIRAEHLLPLTLYFVLMGCWRFWCQVSWINSTDYFFYCIL